MTLGTRITIVAVTVTLLVATALVVTGQISQGQIEQRFAAATTTGKAVLWKKIVAGELQAMANATSGLARDRATRNALRDGDYAALAESANTTFNLLSASGTLTRMQIINLDGDVVFSAPNQLSGKSTKQLVRKALVEGKVIRGVERDDDGRLVAEVAFPLLMRGKVIGIAVYASNLDAVVADFKANDGSEVFVVAKDGTPEYQTEEGLLAQAGVQLPELGSQKVDVVKSNGIVYSAAMLPINGPEGEPLAHLVALNDYTESFSAQSKVKFTALISVVLFVIGAMIGLFLYMRHALRPLRATVTDLQRIADGDLTVKVEATTKDEIGMLRSAMHGTVEQLHNMIEQINVVTGQLSSSSRRMSDITEETNVIVAQQQSDLEQVATAMHEMTATVTEVARNASDAATAATKADDESQSGSRVVDEAISSIEELAKQVEDATGVINALKENSENIGTILDVIRDIAEQTNLLALNAAIEAARAGEQGRGFAVVADEVRTLASRTQQSTQEIHSMIEQLQQGAHSAVQAMKTNYDRAQRTVDQAGRAGASLHSITEAVSTINNMNIQIASAAEQQTAVAEEINRHIIEINEIAERTAAGTKDTAHTSGELNDLATQLTQVVGRFKI